MSLRGVDPVEEPGGECGRISVKNTVTFGVLEGAVRRVDEEEVLGREARDLGEDELLERAPRDLVAQGVEPRLAQAAAATGRRHG